MSAQHRSIPRAALALAPASGRAPSERADAVAHSVLAGCAGLASYTLAVHGLAHVQSISRDDDLLGGMWAVIATLFVYRQTYERCLAAATSRIAATSVSFVLCLAYLLVLPFHPWGLALLIALSALIMRLAGRAEDAMTAGITTAVVMVVAALSPRFAWEQPILRWVDTLVGVLVGIAAGWVALRLTRAHGQAVASASRSPAAAANSVIVRATSAGSSNIGTWPAPRSSIQLADGSSWRRRSE